MGAWGCKEMPSTVSWLTISALVYEPKCAGMGGLGVDRSPNKLGRSDSISNIYGWEYQFMFAMRDHRGTLCTPFTIIMSLREPTTH